MNTKVIDLIQQKATPNRELISALEEMLKQAKEGYIQSLLCTYRYDNFIIDTEIIGIKTEHYITNLGMIEDLKIEMLKYYGEQNG